MLRDVTARRQRSYPPVPIRCPHPRFVRRNIDNRLVDEGPALLTPRRIAQNKASFCRRRGGPLLVHEVPPKFFSTSNCLSPAGFSIPYGTVACSACSCDGSQLTSSNF